jgi:hypothetical protein
MGTEAGTPVKHKWRKYVEDWNYDAPYCEMGTTFNYDRELSTEECSDDFCCGSSHILTECQQAQGDFNWSTCSCNFSTPIIIDVNGDGFRLTSFSEGVKFDVASCGMLRQTAWTARGSDDAFLVLDRNANGIVDGGKEWFGNHTDQPDLKKPRNGFEALRLLDTNGDGKVGLGDPQFAELQLWTDRNHNGRSDADELRGLWE